MLLREGVNPHQLGKARKFLAENPVFNVLPLGDTYAPLLGVSKLFIATEGSAVTGVCSVYHPFNGKPSVALSTATPETKRALLGIALRRVSGEFITLCSRDEVEVVKAHATVLRLEFELQMVANPPKHIKSNVKVSRARKKDVEGLDRFYSEQDSRAWTPLQFKVGPFYCVKRNGKIVSAAGTHLKTPQIACIGSIATSEAYRRQGFAAACTSALASDLASKGRIISLFVRCDNKPAISMYEKLGFRKIRETALITARKDN
jgi:ribosomal protein S18 acetylase RimI-like enzyme